MSVYTDKTVDVFYGGDSIQVPLARGKKGAKILHNFSKHYPNKDEAQELRKIMASTGLSEEAIRQDPKYRKMLSEAQKQGQKAKRTETQRTFQKLIKKACQQTGLVPQHPETIKVLQEILDTGHQNYFGRTWWERNKTTAENIVKQYAKK